MRHFSGVDRRDEGGGHEVTVSDSHTAGATLTIEANSLAEAINTGLDT